MSNVRFDELELMLMAMFEQPTLRDTIQVLTEAQPLVAEDAEMAVLVQQTIQKMQQLNKILPEAAYSHFHPEREPDETHHAGISDSRWHSHNWRFYLRCVLELPRYAPPS